MSLVAIDHVQLAMPPGGEDAARRFYGDVLGLPETPKPEHLAKRGGCWFEDGGLKIHLGVEADFHPARKAHPGLLVSDLPALKARLSDGGFAPKDDEPLEGYDRIYVDDPFGNRIELLEPLSSGERFGLDGEQYEYARRLAYEAAYGAWAGSSKIVADSKAFLEGEVTDAADQCRILTDLLKLAAEDPDHEWEAPTLTGYPTSFALAALKKINETHA